MENQLDIEFKAMITERLVQDRGYSIERAEEMAASLFETLLSLERTGFSSLSWQSSDSCWNDSGCVF